MIHLPTFRKRYRATLCYIAVMTTAVLVLVLIEAFGWVR